MLEARPAAANTCRCFVIAWRVMQEPAARREIDNGSPADNREISRKRVSSPSAAKIGAALRLGRLCRLADISFDCFHLYRPALLVASVGFRAACERNAVETRFHYGEHCSFGSVLQLEDD